METEIGVEAFLSKARKRKREREVFFSRVIGWKEWISERTHGRREDQSLILSVFLLSDERMR